MKIKLLFSALIFLSFLGHAQVGINTDTPHAETDLELASPDRALLLNRVEDADAIQNPVPGMILYDITDECVKVYQKGKWHCIEIVLSDDGDDGDGDDGDENEEFPFGLPDTLPKMYLTTDDGEDIPHDQKKVYKPGDITVEGMGLGDYTGRYSLRGRGNSSWGKPKKPYRIKLDNKESLLGLAKEKSYILLNNYSDGTLFQNALPFKMGQDLGMPHTNHIIPVLLYINEEPRGVYAFTEQKHVKKNRIELDEDGVLLELDTHYDEDTQWRNSRYYTPIMLAYPEIADTDPLFLEIKAEMDDIIELLYNNGEDLPDPAVENYIDIEQAANYYLVWQITRNADFQLPNSVYIHKQNAAGKWKYGILWDFDNTYGRKEAYGHYRMAAVEGNSVFSYHDWMTPFVRLYELPNVKAKIKERWAWWKENKMEEYFEYFDRYAELSRQGFELDYTLYPMHPVDKPGDRGNASTNFDFNKTKYLTWLNARIAWMDDYIDAM